MRTKEVNIDQLAKEIATYNDAAQEDRFKREDIIKRLINTHLPREENIVRPWDVIRYKGNNDRYLVTTRKAYDINTKEKTFNRYIPIWNGDRFLHFSIPDDNVITEDGKPVTGYRDENDAPDK